MNSEKEKLKSALEHYRQAKQHKEELIKYEREEAQRRRENFIAGIFRILAKVLLFGLGAVIISLELVIGVPLIAAFADFFIGAFKWIASFF